MSAKISTALHTVMTKVGYVQKTGKNSFHGYRYAGEADLLDKLRPAMIEAGLLLMPSVRTVTGPDVHGNVTVEIDYTLAHKDGDIWPEKLTAVGCGNDRAKNGAVGDKGVYKALTGANKYLLFKLFQIETGDDPEQSDVPAPEPERAPVTFSSVKPAEPEDESARRYVVESRRKIANWPGTEAELRHWWQSEGQARRAFDLTQEQVDALKALLGEKLKAYAEADRQANLMAAG